MRTRKKDFHMRSCELRHWGPCSVTFRVELTPCRVCPSCRCSNKSKFCLLVVQCPAAPSPFPFPFPLLDPSSTHVPQCPASPRAEPAVQFGDFLLLTPPRLTSAPLAHFELNFLHTLHFRFLSTHLSSPTSLWAGRRLSKSQKAQCSFLSLCWWSPAPCRNCALHFASPEQHKIVA